MSLDKAADRVKEIYAVLHAMPEPGFEEHKTAAYLAAQLRAAGYEVQTGIGGTGVVGTLKSGQPGPTVALRADMDAMSHLIGGQLCAVHSCGHDAHSAMVLTVAERAARQGIKSGTLKILFQPAEELLFGALRVIEAGVIDDVDVMLGIHLRPHHEAKFGQATPALYHGASYVVEAVVEGRTAHGARPHLGINAADAAAACVFAVNAIRTNPVIPSSIKTTKLQASAGALNAIPARAEMAFDIRSQDNGQMAELLEKVKSAVAAAAAAVGAKADVTVKGGVPAAQYDAGIIELAREAILSILGEKGLLPPAATPGGEDFHFYAAKKPGLKAGYIGLGCDLAPGLHDPTMTFNQGALIYGVDILSYMINKLLNNS